MKVDDAAGLLLFIIVYKRLRILSNRRILLNPIISTYDEKRIFIFLDGSAFDHAQVVDLIPGKTISFDLVLMVKEDEHSIRNLW